MSPTATASPDFTAIPRHGPGLRGADFGFHLHGLQNQQYVALGHRLALAGDDFPDGARQWRGYRRTGACRGGNLSRGGRRRRSGRRQRADIAAVADLHHKGFPFHFHGVDAGGGRFLRFCHRLRGFHLRYWLKGRRVMAVLKELQADLRE
ncbi:Uncharacterised protein [Klebsiella michiganensis]|nr:Uncharacterised protein [Klebsiella michiganensis]